MMTEDIVRVLNQQLKAAPSGMLELFKLQVHEGFTGSTVTTSMLDLLNQVAATEGLQIAAILFTSYKIHHFEVRELTHKVEVTDWKP